MKMSKLTYFLNVCPHLFVGVQDGQQQVMRGQQSAFLLQREARQEAAFLVVALGGLLTQPRHSAGVGLTGAQCGEDES